MADAKLTIKDLPTAVTVAEDADLLALWDDSDNTTSQFSVADLKTSVINPLIAAEAAIRSAADVTLQNNIDLKADTDSPTLTGIPLAPTATSGTDTDQLATTAFVKTAVDAASGAVVSVNGATGAVVLDATSVGLGDFTGLTPATLPLSTAETAALATKEPSISSGLSSQVWQGDKTWIAKTSLPISTAQQTALDTKEPNITVGTTGDYWRGDKTFQPVSSLAISTATQAALDVRVITYANRSAAVAANVPATMYKIAVMAGTVCLEYVRDAAGTAMTTADGGTWSPATIPTPNHWAENTTPGTTDMTAAYQAALNYAAGKSLEGIPGQIYGISTQLSLKSGTTWDLKGSTLTAIAAASSSFFSLWQPENGASKFRVTNGNIDGNSQLGMIGFILRVGAHNGKVDNLFITGMTHDKTGVDGGRGFNIESIATVLDNSNLIVSNITIRSSYMGYSLQSGSGVGARHNVIVNNITVEDCDVVRWTVANGAGYPFDATSMQIVESNIIAKNCGKQNLYTNGGGAFVSDRGCNIKSSNLVLTNDSTYGSIPAVWHGNGANWQVDITYFGDCTNFWDFRAYKEADGVNPTENTIQNSHMYGHHYGTCTDIAYIGSATTSFAVDVHIYGEYATVSSDNPVTTNLRQSGLWFDVFETAQKARVIGRGDIIAAALFTTYNSSVARLGNNYFGTSGAPTYSPTVYSRDASTDMTGGFEISSFNPSIKFRDLSGSSHTGAIFQNGTVLSVGFDTTPTGAATWSYKYGFDIFGLYPLTDLSGTSGKATNAWSYTFAQYHAVKDSQAIPTTVTGFTSCFNDVADNHYKIKNGSGTVKRLASALLDMARFVPTTGQSITMTADANIIDPAGTLAALTTTLPLLYDGQMITMTFSQIITALTITPNGSNGSLANAITAATAGQVIRLRYNSAANKLFNA